VSAYRSARSAISTRAVLPELKQKLGPSQSIGVKLQRSLPSASPVDTGLRRGQRERRLGSRVSLTSMGPMRPEFVSPALPLPHGPIVAEPSAVAAPLRLGVHGHPNLLRKTRRSQ